jgi:Ca2+-binding RTX toxin-like protein
MIRRTAVVAMAALAAGALPAAPALAALPGGTVYMSPDGLTLTYNAAGFDDDVINKASGTTIRINDVYELVAGTGCRHPSPADRTAVDCAAPLVTRVTVRLNDGNEVLRNESTLPITVDGGPGHDRITGGVSAELLVGNEGDDILDGGAGDDIVEGYWHSDILYGGVGNDILRGGENDDTMYGGAGDDGRWGDAGNDDLNGGDGVDLLDGGTHTTFDSCINGEGLIRCER